MAYQTRPRDPLLEEHMQAAIRKRGSELIGFALIAVGVLFGMIMWSYSPDDPSRFNVTSAPAQNILGEFGAAIASTLILTIGKAAWVIPLLTLTWGVRFVLHIGEKRAISRAIFSPIFAAVSAIFLAAHVPAETWTHSFGLGGLFGDMVLGLLVDLSPMSLGFGLAVITLILGTIAVTLGLYVLGFTLSELRTICRYAFMAIVLSYASIVNAFAYLMGKVRGYRLRSAERAAEKAQLRAEEIPVEHNADFVKRTEPVLTQNTHAPVAQEEPAPSLASKLSLPSLPTFGLGKRQEPEIEAEQPHIEPQMHRSTEESAKLRISETIKNKVSAKRAEHEAKLRIEPVLSQQAQHDDAVIEPTSPQVSTRETLVEDTELDLNDPVENIFSVPTP